MKLKPTLLAVFGGLLLTTSCKQADHSINEQQQQTQENPYVQRLVLNERILLAETDGPTCTLSIDMDFYHDFSALNRAVIENAFGIKDQVSFVMAAALYHDTVQKNYRKDMGELRRDFPEETSNLPFSHEYMLHGRILDTGRIYQTYRLKKYTYLGGAHGMSSVHYFNFLNGEKIGVAEAFGKNNEEKLERLLLECLMAKEGVAASSQLAEKGYWVGEDSPIAASEDFYCTQDTCYFFYQPYEIAAGYKGVVEIPVPQAKLRDAGIFKQ